MLVQVEHRLSESNIPNFHQKDKSWQSVMDYSEETGGNRNTSEEIEQGSNQQEQQEIRQNLLRQELSTNTLGTSNSGLPRIQQYSTGYQNIQSNTGGSLSATASANAQTTTSQFNPNPYLNQLQLNAQPLQPGHMQMAPAAGPMAFGGAGQVVYNPQHQLPQHAQTYSYPPYPGSSGQLGQSQYANTVSLQQFTQQQLSHYPPPVDDQQLEQQRQQQESHYHRPVDDQQLEQQRQQQRELSQMQEQALQGLREQLQLHQQSQHQHPLPQQEYNQQQILDINTMALNTSLQQGQHTQEIMCRPPAERPIIKLSRSLIDTYKYINIIYEQEQEEKRAKKKKEKKDRNERPSGIQGVRNNGYDDENYDYILTNNELIDNRYKVQERLGKGSFGQVVRAIDTLRNVDVAIKIIKSKKPFQVQARTEIEILTHLKNRDTDDEHNIVRLLSHFMYRNHQCLVFEMLSLNLYELLKNTQFVGVSLHLIRKFAKQILKSLQFLSRPDVDVIHCDLKPENILLRNPKRSGVKVIDFGSSCRSDNRMYPYIQSRFYRSPEVLLGLPYTVAIDMWSLGCILFEMHTGEPLFSGSDQFDQMQKIVKILGMVPDEMLNRVDEEHRNQFFLRSPSNRWMIKQKPESSTNTSLLVAPSLDPIASLMKVLENRINSNQQSISNYKSFVDLIYRMLAYNPEQRITPEESMLHPFIVTELGSRQNSST